MNTLVAGIAGALLTHIILSSITISTLKNDMKAHSDHAHRQTVLLDSVIENTNLLRTQVQEQRVLLDATIEVQRKLVDAVVKNSTP